MSLIIRPRALRIVRGIRDSIPPDSVIGRSGGSSDGPAHVIPLRDLANGMVSAGFVAAPANLSEQLDALFGSAEGSLIQRGPSVWQGLAPGTLHQILMSGGAAALNSWQSVSAILDAVFGSTRGDILYRGASGWAALPPGVTGHFLQTQFSTGDPVWHQLITGAPGGGNLVEWSSPTQISNGNLSGDVTTSGTLATTIQNNAVTLAKIANASASSRLLGSGASGSGASYSEIALGTGLSMSGTTLNVSGAIANSGGLINIQYLTSGTTYTPTTGTNSVLLVMIGGGGGGSGVPAAAANQVSCGGGGGAGATLIKRLTSGFSGASYSIGSAGSGGAAGLHDGGDGGDTTFTVGPTIYTAGGGKGGASQSSVVPAAANYPSTKGAGGSPTNGDTPSAAGFAASQGLIVSIFVGIAGGGGLCPYGLAGSGAVVANGGSVAGFAASGFGSGGGGASASNGGGAKAGGNGAPGLIMAFEFS